MSAAQTIMEYLGKVPEPLQGVIRAHLGDNRLGTKLGALQSRFSLTADQQRSVETESIMVLCGVTGLPEFKDNLIAEAGLNYETAVRLQRALENDVLNPISAEAESLGYVPSTDGHSPPPLSQPPARDETLYTDSMCRVTYSTLQTGATSYPIAKIASVMDPLQLDFPFGGFFINLGLCIAGLYGIASLSPLWMLIGLGAVLLGGWNVYGSFNEPWWITVTLVNGEEFQIKRPKKPEIFAIHEALRRAISG